MWTDTCLPYDENSGVFDLRGEMNHSFRFKNSKCLAPDLFK